ncbi:unnamed protein product [Porites lobata]|uniref:Link domain-containing protein n=1 Tax=Porites lobata TaxID=104759 RepID=A0ABN8N000_9CNID|nr:unnamed protein product [Porites lobata]
MDFGGTCTRGPGLGKFSCQCKAQVTVLPFIDNRCNVIELYIKHEFLFFLFFHTRIARMQAHFFTHCKCRNAKRFCDLLGATAASYDMLYSAWKAALQKCAYGWLADGTVRYPMHVLKSNCGNKTGIVGSSTPRNKTKMFDVWCYKET